MDKRVAKVNISPAGGTAARGAKTCKITVPNTWMEALGISQGQRELDIAFDGKQVVISRRLAGGEFAARKLEQGHDVRLFRFFDGDELCTTIHADITDETLAAGNHVGDPVRTAFGNCEHPTWDDFLVFLQDRCIPMQRAGLREYLEVIGVGEYDPLQIIQKTAGRMAEDSQWLDMESMI